ncbi:MAG: HAD hydrolase-like protein [Methanomassiliicoccaceae archaeon]|jgi:phosphoglycolate phosphatase|nr:HAD hydrolase-like protein [Methanomassiliicoccaceae archaeon]
MRYDAVIFDIDGTLMDSSESIICAVEDAVRELGYPKTPSREEIIPNIGSPLGKLVIAVNGFVEDEIKRFNPVFDNYKKEHVMNVKMYPGMMELLSDLSAVSFIGIATNKREDYTKTLLDNLNISPLCDEIQALDFGYTLKKKDLVANCIKASGIEDRSRIVLIGDTRTDESAARECGVDFIGVTFGFGFKNEADITYGHVAADVRSVREILFT